MSFKLSERDLCNEDVLCKKIVDLSNIVFNRHFYINLWEKEDLISVGVVKALSLIREGNWRKEKGNLVTFLYSGIRNEMHNYIYRVSREVCYGDFYYESDSDGVEPDENYGFLDIEFRVVREVCSCFSGYGDLTCVVVSELSKVGFNILNSECDNMVCSINTDYDVNLYTDLISRLKGAVIWKTREYYR